MAPNGEAHGGPVDLNGVAGEIARMRDGELLADAVRLRVLESHHRSVRRFLPLNATLVVAANAVSTPATDAITRIMAGLGGGLAISFYLTYARVARHSRRSEDQYAAEHHYDLAAWFALARSQRLDMLPNARSRQGLAGLRAIEYAARSGRGDLLFRMLSSLEFPMTNASTRTRRRLVVELDAFADRVDAWPAAWERLVGRTAIAAVGERIASPHLGRYQLETGVALYLASEEAVSTLVDPAGEMTALFGAAVATGGGDAFMAWALQEARTLMMIGLVSTMRRDGSDRADALVRAVVASERVPLPMVLEAYRRAMDRCDDPRATMFGVLLGEPDPEKVAALALIGYHRPAPGLEPPTLGR